MKEVNRLFDLKVNSPEVKEILAVQAVNRYLEESIARIKETLQLMEEERTEDWDLLNTWFLQVV